MNFQDLLAKIKTIDESDNAATSPTDSMLVGEKNIGGDPTDDFISDVSVKDVATTECGSMPGSMPSQSPMKQQDNVTMNVSMNGSGAGGIRDLMGILKNIEQADSDKGNVVFGTEEFANEPNEKVAPISAVTPTGNDMHSKGGEAPKVNGGGNPMREALVQKLSAHYESIKERAIDPVRSADVQQVPQKVAPQANRPGLASNGDPKLWDIQFELQKQGYKIKVDGLNGPETEKVARIAGLVKNTTQDVANPTAASSGFNVGHTIGSGIGWIETAWRNLKQGFKAGQAGLEEAGEEKTMSRAAKGHEKYGKEGMQALAKAGREGASEKELDNIRDKHDKYDEAINESANIIKLSKMLNG